MMRRSLGCVLLALAACGPSALQPQFTTPRAPTEDALVKSLGKSAARVERPVVVGLTDDPMRLFAYDLAHGLLWEREAKLRSAPLVVGDAIVAQEARGVVVRDLATGDVRVLVDDGGQLVGADGRGDELIVSIAYPEADPRGAVAYVAGRKVRWKRALALPVGVPALADHHVLVPWATQRLSVLDAKDGTELARWHFPHTVVGHALIEDGRPFAGQQGIFSVDERATAPGVVEPALYTPQKRTLPGQPPLLRDGYLPVDEPDNAVHRLQLSWQPAVDGNGLLHARNEQLLLRFYRQLFALDARADSLQWVRTFEHDLVGVAIVNGGSLLIDDAGTLRVLDSAGNTRGARDLGRKVRVASIRPGAWIVPDAAPSESPLPNLRLQLVAAAALDDARLSAGRAYAVEQLGRLADEAVTTDLIALCENQKSPEPVFHTACDQLAARSLGADAILAALARKASYLKGTEAPPIGALAPVAARMKLAQAAPLLLQHLEDPATPVAALAPSILALEQLGHAPAVEPLQRFVRLHHDEPEGSELGPAMDAALHALGALGVRSARPSLLAVVDDGLAPASTRQKAGTALTVLDAPRAAKAVEPKPEPAEELAPAAKVDERPYELSAPMVDEALANVADPLARCVSADPHKPRVGRISMVVDSRGAVEGVFVTPSSLQACFEPLLRKATFPETRLGRQRITHEVWGTEAKAEKKKVSGKK